MSEFAITLKSLRQSEKLTQGELSEKLKISKSAISMYENGNREPDYETLELIADFFNVDMSYLLKGSTKYNDFSDADSSFVKEDPAEYDIITMAAHKVGHEGDLTQAEKEDIELAIQIALAKHKNKR